MFLGLEFVSHVFLLHLKNRDGVRWESKGTPPRPPKTPKKYPALLLRDYENPLVSLNKALVRALESVPLDCHERKNCVGS